MDAHDEDLRLALELSLVESLQAPGPTTPLRSSATWARTSTQIAAGRDEDEEMARILRLGREEQVAEEERMTRLAQRESEREHQEFLEQPATLAEVQQWTTDDVCAWLEREGLGRHAKAFRNEVVDGPTLLEIGDTELASCLGPHASKTSPSQTNHNHTFSNRSHYTNNCTFSLSDGNSIHVNKAHTSSNDSENEKENEKSRSESESGGKGRSESEGRRTHVSPEEEDTLLAKQLELESSLEAGEVMDLTALEAVSAAADAAAAAPPVPAPIARLAPTRPAPPLPLWSLLTQRLAHATQDAEDHQMSYEDLVSLPNVAVGVRDIDRLPTMTFRAGMTCEPSCVICLSDFTTGDTLRRMECMHVFHKECVDKWLQQSKKCPSCNREMDL
ncbi:zinc finger, C3HC4 type (RING finger) domain containing protein [Acanthamoeba castellanii str. Neff]|uniref:Zinc finger, C3HC4 type (RING finger) domain containing protein n=1 Tax=Acanthamoeba castellanii (strain ATCC 30010 / Neff) TaxID=1257118 RepID=L8H758_ACACF|nr:zinc finger, C3HC4 type (RING finger) domain containing protein [Acanthamoeba castellanii str. Neff]ELR20311.1 zinc finger, C3HC4 type (RING finger) domain containing protein [Acanthamoeba castellanii str. Neff]